jgi:hypothetical protein
MAVTKKQKKEIIDAVVKGVQRNGERILNISQDTAGCFVSVNTGNLKRSGSVVPLDNGVRIQYLSPYASEVENGIESDIPIQGDQVVTIKTHTRKGYTNKNGVYVQPTVVPEHKVTYHNARLIGFRPKLSKFEYSLKIFRVIKKIKARPGQFYLGRAVSLGLESLHEDIKFCLQRVGRVK